MLHWPQLSDQERGAIEGLLAGCDTQVAQQLLDELAGALETNSIKTSPSRWFRAVVVRCKRGEFEPSAGIAVADRRIRHRLEAGKKQEAKRVAAPEQVRSHLESIETLLKGRSSSGGH
ncbi:hypothetical protein FKV24_002250 [Lysobacter maris]|uniref:Uncharacterized protein n=1 Tax=Marilutibacter maris TaxID=1605891 RepID=A0A508B1U8_9GAMM|nr:hypothetical protein [Lysobacter maris]KAB8198408.1 hypothetical protein FKV24_002250 [Lysobacter maris]